MSMIYNLASMTFDVAKMAARPPSRASANQEMGLEPTRRRKDLDP